ncbi:long-chain-fatty-acid--CoA ligase [Pendulispora albinea]|uniref:Long-chain-fatty-acid--CoA ligase n=1 Tax=Pendulispora albinea TaxID=2741071 RepID=A0ABZ2M9K0_9BACT
MIYDPNVTTLASLIRTQARERPDRIAIVCEEQRITYAELAERSLERAAQLAALSVSKGDRVALLAKDGIASVELLFGCALLGAIFVPINWRLQPAEVTYIVEKASCRAIFVSSELAALAADAGRSCPVVPLEARAHDAPRVVGFPAIDTNDAAIQIYTGGTTGYPKGVQLAHRSFFAIAREFWERKERWLGWTEDDVSLCAVPLFHIGGVWWLVRGLASGATNVLLPQFVGWKAIEAIARHRITMTAFVPAMIAMMLAEPDASPEKFRSLRNAGYGGSPASPALIQAAMKAFGCDVLQVYGLTETGNMAVWLTPDDHKNHPERLLAAGKPYPGVEVKIIDPQGDRLGPMQTGEICIRSPAAMLGYWNDEEATRQTLRDGWIHTGDAGYLDADGYIYISDRIKDMICSAGENVYPAEIERVLSAHPAIREVAVIGVPHPEWGEAIKVVVSLEPGAELDLRDMRTFCRGKLASFKVPSSLDIVDALPRTAIGKIKKTALRETYWAQEARKVG